MRAAVIGERLAQFDVGIAARADLAEHLEHQVVADHDRGIALFGCQFNGRRLRIDRQRSGIRDPVDVNTEKTRKQRRTGVRVVQGVIDEVIAVVFDQRTLEPLEWFAAIRGRHVVGLHRTVHLDGDELDAHTEAVDGFAHPVAGVDGVDADVPPTGEPALTRQIVNVCVHTIDFEPSRNQ